MQLPLLASQVAKVIALTGRTGLVIVALATACTGPWGDVPDDPGGDDTGADNSGGMWTPLIDAAAWVSTDLADDPLASHYNDDSILCAAWAWHPELGGVEVETTQCNYASMHQSTLADIAIGDQLRVLVWWQSLVSVEPATGHLALLIGGAVVWEEFIDIPGAAAVRTVEFASPLAAPAGTPVVFHLHNHGFNTWNLGEFSVRTLP